jgi:hypothetical protein
MLERPPTVLRPRRPKIGPRIVEHFADGKWHAPEEIATMIGADPEHVLETLRGIRKNQTYSCKAEEKRVGTSTAWRIYPLDNPISRREAIDELRPLIEALKIEGKRNMATASPPTVAALAGRLEMLLQKWTMRPAPLPGPRRRGRSSRGPKGDSPHVNGDAHDHHGGNANGGTIAVVPACAVDDAAVDGGACGAIRNDDSVSNGEAAQPIPGPVSPRED